jgi:hypothetical protein
MNLKLLFIIPVLSLAACVTPPQKSAHNPEGLRDQELVVVQQERLAKLEREMERRENEMRYQHLKELQQVQMQRPVRNSECRFLCF